VAYTDIDKPTDYFDTKLYTGNGSNNTSITGVEFQPDWVWVKARNIEYGHKLFDAVRGQGKRLASQSNAAESTVTDELTSFNSDGFTTNSNAGMNENNRPYVAWNWLAGTAFTNDASSTSVGSIDSAGSVNQDAGFSIVSFVGTQSNGTIKHGLSTAPSMIILKSRDTASHWLTGWTALGWTHAIKLNLTSAKETTHYYWNNTAPTSSVFSVGAGTESNKNGDDFIAYCFAEKQGYSKFGSYIGNGNADGTFIFTGLKPAFVMLKRTDAASQWRMWDNKRNTFNVVNKALLPNDASEEQENTNQNIDFLSNGFKIRAAYADTNTSGSPYIYMAFAENPFVTSTGVPATAR